MNDDKRKKSVSKVPPLWTDRYGVRDCLNVGMSKVDEFIATGQLPSFKVGTATRIHKRDLWKFSYEYARDNAKIIERKYEV